MKRRIDQVRQPRLTILAPGLLGPLRGISAAALELPETPGLTRLLDAPDEPGPNDYESAVRGCFELPNGAPPAQAAAGSLADLGRAPAADCLCASPVHLRVETDYLLLYDDELLRVEEAEAAALVAELNRTYGDDGLHLEMATPARWYLTGFAADAVSTRPLRTVRGRSIGPFMPAGARGARLRALMNEIQMLFHDHPVNRARAERGEPAVSGVWLWGEGGLPAVAESPWAAVWADDPWVRGLAQLGHGPAAVRPEALPAVAVGGPALVVLDGFDVPVSYADTAAWLAALAAAERDWFAPAWQALQGSRLAEVEVVPADGRRFVARRRRWPRLRKPRPLAAYLQSEAA